MEEFLAQLSGYSGPALYLILFGILVLCGVGLPLPEDIPLIAAGFFAYLGTVKLPLVIIVAMAGVLIGDSLIFFIGRRWGLSILNHRLFRKVLPEERLDRVRRYFNKYGDKTIFMARFVVGLRAATFWAAGTLKVPYSTFILWDGLAALLSVPAFILLGYWFGDDIEAAMHMLDRVELVIVAVLGLAVVAFVIYELRKRKAAKRVQAED